MPVAAEPVLELPGEDRWWGDPRAAFVAAVIGLLAGGVLGYAIGNSGKTVTTVGRSGATAITHTVTHTNTVTQPKVIERSNTVTATTQTTNPSEAESRSQAEATLRKAERENEELRRQLEER